MAQAVKNGGFLLSSDVDLFGKRHPPEQHLVCDEGFFSAPEETPLIKAYKRLFKGMLPQSWTFDFSGNLEDRIIPAREEYFTFVDIRKKSDRQQPQQK